MLAALSAASSALDMLQSLTAKKKPAQAATPTTGLTQTNSAAFDPTSIAMAAMATPTGTPISGTPQPGTLTPATMGTMIDAQGASSGTSSTSQSDALNDLFSKLDGDGNGQISKSEFEDALGAGGTNTANADAVFAKLDKNGDGSVTEDELGSALKGAGGAGGHGHHHHKVASSDDSSSSSTSADGASDPLLAALDGASSTSTTNSDGSTTTSMTYADGSKASTTSAPTSSASTAASSTYNFIEQMIQRQADAVSSKSTAVTA